MRFATGRWRHIALGSILAAAPTARTAAGQTSVSRMPAGRIAVHGVAYDSLNKTPLRDAFITILGIGQSTTSDSRGRFQFDSVVPGTYTFAMQHAALDSLGVSGASTRALVSDSIGEIVIAVPSFATLWKAACDSAGPPPRDSGFVYGNVRDATNRRPVAGATIDVRWVDIVIDSARGFSQRRWRSQARTDSTGTYSVCGVPSAVGLRVQASADSALSGLIDLLPGDLRVRRRDLYVAPTAVAAARRTTSGTISGVVLNAAGEPVKAARVVMDEAPESRTDSDGRFVVHNVPAGTRQLEIQFVGMLPVVQAVDVTTRDTAHVTAHLRRVTTLDVVNVTASAAKRKLLADFDARRKLGFGYAVDSTEIAHRGTMQGVFGSFPNLEVETSHAFRNDFKITFGSGAGGRCTAYLWIDGLKQPDFEQLSSFHTDEIAAVEVYPHAFSVPPRFMETTKGLCGVVVVWTKWAFR